MQLHILIVDNHTRDGWLWAGALRRAGYRVALAADTDAGWRALETDRYTLLIVSENPMGRTGAELIRKVRAIPETVPCILVSDARSPDPADLAQVIDPGLELEKPVTIPCMLASVRSLLEDRP